MMHLEVYETDDYGRYWPVMEEEILKHYEVAGIRTSNNNGAYY